MDKFNPLQGYWKFGTSSSSISLGIMATIDEFKHSLLCYTYASHSPLLAQCFCFTSQCSDYYSMDLIHGKLFGLALLMCSEARRINRWKQCHLGCSSVLILEYKVNACRSWPTLCPGLTSLRELGLNITTYQLPTRIPNLQFIYLLAQDTLRDIEI